MNEFLERNLGEDDLEKQKAEAASKIVIPASMRAFMVLKRANIDRTQRVLVLSKLDKSDEENMFENMCKELKTVLGSEPGTNKSHINAACKVEQSDLPSEEILYAAGYYRREGKNHLIKKDIGCKDEVLKDPEATGLTMPRWTTPRTPSPRTGRSQSILLTLMPQSQRTGMTKWMVSGSLQ